MKFLITYSFLLFSFLAFAQEVEDFAFIRVPSKFSSFEPNQYQINHYVQHIIKQKKFKVISENQQVQEQYNNPCEMLFVDVTDESSWFTTKIKINFKDCKDQLIGSFDGITGIKDLRKGYLYAVKNALAKLGNYSGKTFTTVDKNSSIHKKNQIKKNILKQEVQKTEEKNINSSAKKETTQNDFIVYSDGFRNYQLEEKGKIFLLKDTENQSLFARLFPTQSPEIYQVKFYDESSAVAYFSKDKITFEKFNNAGEKKTLELNKK